MKNLFMKSTNNSGQDDLEGVPDETTRLLSNHIDDDVAADRRNNNDNERDYLSADDAAVSAYNLLSVRLTRYFTVALLAATVVWWLILFVSVFVTPPGFHTRGSPFMALAYATIAVTSLIASLIFFAAPSRFIRLLTTSLALLLMLSTIMLTAVVRTRHEEGWVGITSIAWAFLVSVWTIAADRTVQWGKAEEEERLTGRSETRRTFVEWIQVTAESIVLIVLFIVSLLLLCSIVLRALDAGLAPPGKYYLVDNNKYVIHVHCRGLKSKEHLPTVLFEGTASESVENGLWQFAEQAVQNGTISRYCFADRPGIAWSDTAPSPLSVGLATDVLSEALAAAGEIGPWVLVGAGVGSLYSRVFSSRHGAEIEGILLVDPLHEDLLYRLSAFRRGFVLWLRGMLSPLGLDRVPGALFRGRSREDRVWGRAAYQNSKHIFAQLQESLVANSLTRRDVVTSRAVQYRDTPLAVVSSGRQMRHDSVWERKQEDLAHLTNKLLAWITVEDAPSEVWQTIDGRATMEKYLYRLVRQERGEHAPVNE